MILFRHFNTVDDASSLNRRVELSDYEFLILPVIDPKSEGGKYLSGKDAYNDFNVSTGIEAEILYFSSDAQFDFNEYKETIARHIDEEGVGVRRRLNRQGFLVFLENFRAVDFWEINCKGRSPSQNDVYSGMSALWKALHSPYYKRVGIGPFSRYLGEVGEMVCSKENVKSLISRFFGNCE